MARPSDAARPVLFSAFALAFAAALPAAEPPRLAVVIAIDQFRADYLDRFRAYFGPDGFARLLKGGAVYEECRYLHAITKTAPGHATILSGVHANVHGIVGNDWLDRATGETLIAVEDPDSPLVGVSGPTSPGGLLERKEGRSPRNFLATTVGDQLKLRHGSRSRVLAVSNKDRAAILLGGKLADEVYWGVADRWVTSRYYRPDLPDWVARLNASHPVLRHFGAVWDRLLPEAAYEATQGPDDVAGESPAFGLGRVFPHAIRGSQNQPSGDFFDAFDISPFSTGTLAELALAGLTADQLGRHAAPDLLAISFSQIDYVGHEYGPDSQEMMDSVLRLDRELAGIFAAVDRQVGRGRWVAVLTADHGAAPLPEKLQALHRGLAAARFRGAALDAQVAGDLTRAFGVLPRGEFWARRDNFGYTLHPSALAARHVTRRDAEAVVKRTLAAWPEIDRAYVAEELEAAEPEGASVLAMSRRSHYPGRSVDVAFVLKPYVLDRAPYGVNHGTPWDYDTHVPLVWYGAGVTPGMHPEPVAVEDLAPTLAAMLHVPRPPQAQGRRLF